MQTYGSRTLSQPCQGYKPLNVIEHLPHHLYGSVKRALRNAWCGNNAAMDRRQLQCLAGLLQGDHPGAAAILREGLEKTLSVQALGIAGARYRTPRSNNPITNLNDVIVS